MLCFANGSYLVAFISVGLGLRKLMDLILLNFASHLVTRQFTCVAVGAPRDGASLLCDVL